MEVSGGGTTDALPSSYPPCYPAGVFVVASAQHLSPLVSRLRAEQRLKPGPNVTVFDAERFAELLPAQHTERVATSRSGLGAAGKWAGTLESPPCTCTGDEEWTGSRSRRPNHVSPLQTSYIRLYEEAVDEVEQGTDLTDASVSLAVTQEDSVLVTLGCTLAGQDLFARLRTPRAQRARSRYGSGDAASSPWPSYMAVHVNGEFSDTALRSYLAPISPLSVVGASVSEKTRQPELLPPVAYIRGVRRFHRVCCPDLATLPSALAALRQHALAHSEGTERHGNARHAQVTQVGEGGKERDATATTTTPTLASTSPAFTFSELFGGIGMFRTAFEAFGGRAVFAVENAPPAQMVYALNHTCWHDCPATLQLPNAKPDTATSFANARAPSRPPPLLIGDITEIPSAFFPRHDVLTGGFPCQSFAKAGVAAGLNAEKGWLFYEVVRVVAATQPAAFLLENVEHLVEVESGAQLKEILRRLRRPSAAAASPATCADHDDADDGDESGMNRTAREKNMLEYDVRHVVVDGGLLTPQTRRRVYFFGIRKIAASLNDEGQETQWTEAVVADALGRLQAAAKCAPYSCVLDVLEASPVKDLPARTESSGVHDLCTREANILRAELQLTPAQWEAVRRSHAFRQNPLWRVCDLHGRARTLLGSYRTSYQLYSEFVPFAPALTLAEVMNILMASTTTVESRGKHDASCTSSGEEGDVTAADSAPPLRFFSIRECARLQGISDRFILPHAGDDDSDDAEQITLINTPPPHPLPSVSSAVLRRVPSGAVYKLIGNAVNPRVVECLAGAIATHLNRLSKSRR